MNGKTGEVLRWAIGLAAAAVVAYFTAQGTTNERLAVLETKWTFIQESLKEIKANQAKQDADFQRTLREWVQGVDRRTGEPLPLQRAFEQPVR